MAYTSVPIHLSLDECAALLQLNPAHFNGAHAEGTAWGFCSAECVDLWCQDGWQSNHGLARSSLAQMILQAETEVGRYLGTPLAPKATQVILPIVPPLQPCRFTGATVTIGDHLQNYIPYAPTPIVTIDVADTDPTAPTLTYKDEDGDGAFEVAEIEFATTTPVTESTLVLYAEDAFAIPARAIRPLDEIEIVQADDEYAVKLRLPAWRLLQPQLHINPQIRSCNCLALDLTDEDLFLTSVTVGVMQPQISATVNFIYEEPEVTCGNPDCLPCTEQAVTGLFTSKNRQALLYPAVYDPDTDTWVDPDTDSCTCIRWPSMAQITYYQAYCPPTPRSELCDEVKMAIALIAGARLQVNDCDCDCGAGVWFKSLQQDLAEVRGAGRYTTQGRLDNPFGTLRGEQMAYDRLRSLTGGLVVRYGSH